MEHDFAAPLEQPSFQRWEYCELIMYHSSHRDESGGIPCDFEIQYLSNSVFEIASFYEYRHENRRTWRAHPFYEAVGLLGHLGWEMVSMQYQDGGSRFELERSRRNEVDLKQTKGILNYSCAVAVFKRPVLLGRRVDKPEIVGVKGNDGCFHLEIR
jgi:hypothetical protein